MTLFLKLLYMTSLISLLEFLVNQDDINTDEKWFLQGNIYFSGIKWEWQAQWRYYVKEFNVNKVKELRELLR